MLIFLALNDVHLDYSQDELIDVVLKVAFGDNNYDQFLNWVLNHQILVK